MFRHTSGERNADVVIVVLRVPVVAVHALGVEVTDVDQVAILRTGTKAFRLCRFVRGNPPDEYRGVYYHVRTPDVSGTCAKTA